MHRRLLQDDHDEITASLVTIGDNSAFICTINCDISNGCNILFYNVHLIHKIPMVVYHVRLIVYNLCLVMKW